MPQLEGRAIGIEVQLSGRRELSRPRTHALWLPDEAGHLRLEEVDLGSGVHQNGALPSPEQPGGGRRRLRAVG